MCGPTTNPLPASTKASSSWYHGILLPLHPVLAVAAMAYGLPTWCYLNRGFTVWFHLASVLQVLTQSEYLTHVLAWSGTSICLGWYASLVYEFAAFGRFCHPLYKNMPAILMEQMIPDPTTGVLDFESTHSLLAMLACHVLDFLGHPLLAYYHWKKSRNITNTNEKSSSWAWPVLLGSYAFSRAWSLVHTQYNFGKPGWFYMGFDVYVIDDLSAWYPAYIVESLFYATLVAWKLTSRTTNTIKAKKL